MKTTEKYTHQLASGVSDHFKADDVALSSAEQELLGKFFSILAKALIEDSVHQKMHLLSGSYGVAKTNFAERINSSLRDNFIKALEKNVEVKRLGYGEIYRSELESSPSQALKDYLNGIAQAMNFFPLDWKANALTSDSEALRSDWLNVKSDFAQVYDAIKSAEKTSLGDQDGGKE